MKPSYYTAFRKLSHRSLRLEPLEDRCMLAGVTVGNATDDTNGDTSSIIAIMSNDGGDGISLREAIIATNNSPGADEITFDFGHDGRETILLTQGELAITDSLTIAGNDQSLLTINAQQLSRVFSIDDGQAENQIDVNLINLALSNGKAQNGVDGVEIVQDPKMREDGESGGDGANGGAIISAENLLLVDSIISGSTAGEGGSGANFTDANSFDGYLGGNGGQGGSGGAIFSSGGALDLVRSTIIGNRAGHGGGGGSSADYYGGGGNGGRGGSGGAVFAHSGLLTITDSEFSANASGNGGSGGQGGSGGGDAYSSLSSFGGDGGNAGNGGGIAAELSLSTITGSVIGQNTSGDGGIGGIGGRFDEIYPSGRSGHGGGVYSNGGELSVIGSTISGNVRGYTYYSSNSDRGGKGGGLHARLGNLTITSSTLSENRAFDYYQRGTVGVYFSGSDSHRAIISGSTISGNDGGGLLRRIGNVDIVQSTIAANNRFGISKSQYISDQNRFFISGSILDNEDSEDVRVGELESGGYNLLGPDSTAGLDLFSADPTNLIGVDPLLGPLADNGGPTKTHALLPGSPALDAGDIGIVDPPMYDQRGEPFLRITDGNLPADVVIDIGAYESQGIPSYSPGDYDHNGHVDAADYTLWRDTLGQTVTAGAGADGDHSGIIDTADYAIWRSNFGNGLLLGSLIVGNATDDTNGDTSSIIALMSNDGGDGISLREAIIATNNTPGADEITFDFGHDGPETIFLTQGELQIADNLTITGDGPSLLAVDAQKRSRIINVDDSQDARFDLDVTLDGITFQNGGPPNAEIGMNGGGIRFGSIGQLTLQQTVWSHSTTGHYGAGGAIYADGGHPSTGLGDIEVRDSQIINNTAGRGGGGIYSEGSITVYNSAIKNNNLTIDASENPQLAGGGGIYSGSGAVSVIESTISHNVAIIGGGGILSTGGNVSVSDSSITGNTVDGNGGGISIRSGDLTVTDSDINDNKTFGLGGYGGGIRFYDAFNPAVRSHLATIRDSRIIGNSTDGTMSFGGGLAFFFSDNVLVSNSVLTGNTTHGDLASGGGIVLHGTSAEILNSTVSNNSTLGSSALGGGIAMRSEGSGGTLVLKNSTLSNNTTHGESSHGGGVYSGHTLLINNSTVVSNKTTNAAASGGGVATQGDATAISNSIIASNHSTNAANDLWGLSPESIDVEFSIIGNNTGTNLSESQIPGTFGNIVGTPTNPIDPRLGPLSNNGGPTKTHALLPGSPALDAGDIGIVDPPMYDQRGEPFLRITDGNLPADVVIDIGAYESQGVPSFSPGDYNRDGHVDAADYTLWRDTLGQTVTAGAGADGDHSGIIDTADYAIWRSKFGNVLLLNAGSGSAQAQQNEPTDAAFAQFIQPQPVTALVPIRESKQRSAAQSIDNSLLLLAIQQTTGEEEESDNRNNATQQEESDSSYKVITRGDPFSTQFPAPH